MEKNKKVDNNTLYTRCPTCSTAFKVTEQLLAAAGGKVRCGACLAIFQATDYMLKPSEQARPADNPPTASQPSQLAPESSQPSSPLVEPAKPQVESNSTYQPVPDFETEPEFETEPDIEKETSLEENSSLKQSPHFEFVEDMLTDSSGSHSTEAHVNPLERVEPTFESAGQLPVEPEFESEPSFESEDDTESTTDQAPTKSAQDLSDDAQKQADIDSLDFESTQAEDEASSLEDPDQLSIEDENTADPTIDTDVVTDISDELSSDESGELLEKETHNEESNDVLEQLSDFDYENQSFDFDDEPSDFDETLKADMPIEAELSDLPPAEQPELVAAESNEPPAEQTYAQEAEERHIEPEVGELVNETSEEFETAQSPTEIEDLGITTESRDEFQPQESFDELESLESFDEEIDELSDQLSEQMQETDSDPDPLDEFEQIVEENHSGIKSKLIAAVIGILVVIFFQQVWSNRQSLAWSDTWGGTIKSVCNYLPCELKAKRDVKKIKLLQRQLAPDEELENMLDVKLLLINEADFDQPYPTIKIAFSNTQSEQVAVKSFPPEYYLEGEAINSLMPNNSEVHIHFKTELTHPGALGFQFSFE